MAEIVIIDDDELFSEMLSMVMDMHGHHSRFARTLAGGKALLQSAGCDVVFLDMRLPDGNGIELLPWLRSMPAAPDVILLTALGDPESAEKAIIEGAWDYLEKPSSLEQMAATLERILQGRQRRARSRDIDVTGLVGASPRFQACLDVVAEAAATDTNVLITGETGTGKELFARALHRNSRRVDGPFVTVDCAALSPSLMESELFGFRRGSFTGAVGSRTGLVGQADGGTLFLDEVGELPLAQQKAFLRVLQEHRYRPVGSDEELTSDFRLLAATNRNLEDMCREGLFREDLLFRIQAVTVRLPALRERLDDLPALVNFHVYRMCQVNGYPEKTVSGEVLRALSAYAWPGNVRELVNVVERIVHNARDEAELLPEHLPLAFRAFAAKSRIHGAGAQGAFGGAFSGSVATAQFGPAQSGPPHAEGMSQAVGALPGQHAAWPGTGLAVGDAGGPIYEDGTWRAYRKRVLDEAEYAYLSGLLRRSRGNVREAAAIAGLSMPRLYALLRKHQLVKQWGTGIY